MFSLSHLRSHGVQFSNFMVSSTVNMICCKVPFKFITIWLLFYTVNAQKGADQGNNPNSNMPRVEDIMVVETNSTAIVLSWEIESNFMKDLHSLSVWYRPRGRINLDEPRIEYDRDADRYTARIGVDESVYKWKNAVSTKFDREPVLSKRNEMLIYITGLFANLKYDVIVHRITNSSDSVNRTAQIVAKTQWAAIKSGAGCFRVVGSRSSDRDVKFYWRGYGEPGEYDIVMREEGPCDKFPKLVERGKLARSTTFDTISRKRHWFVIKRSSHPEAGETVVNVPDQNDILLVEPANMRVGWNRSEGLYTVTWTKPTRMNVANYTIMWMGVDSRSADGRLYEAIMDVVHIPGDRTSFVMKTKEKAHFLLAANTDTSSTGLLPPVHYEDTEKGSIPFTSITEYVGLP